MTINASDIFAKALENEGVSHVFGVPGEENLDFLDPLADKIHGGFGLLNIHGIAKPAYRAYELLHALGTEMLPVEGTHSTVDAWAVRAAQSATILLTKYTLPRHPIATETVQIKLGNAPPPDQVTIRRIDSNHANAKQRWQEMGSPEYLSAATVMELHTVSRCEPEPHSFDFRDGALGFDVILPPLSVAAVTVRFAERDRD